MNSNEHVHWSTGALELEASSILLMVQTSDERFWSESKPFDEVRGGGAPTYELLVTCHTLNMKQVLAFCTYKG